MPLYAASIGAIKQQNGVTSAHVLALAVIAQSEDEATGMALRRAKEQWPVEAGWGNHMVSVVLVPKTMLKDAAR